MEAKEYSLLLRDKLKETLVQFIQEHKAQGPAILNAVVGHMQDVLGFVVKPEHVQASRLQIAGTLLKVGKYQNIYTGDIGELVSVNASGIILMIAGAQVKLDREQFSHWRILIPDTTPSIPGARFHGGYDHNMEEQRFWVQVPGEIVIEDRRSHLLGQESLEHLNWLCDQLKFSKEKVEYWDSCPLTPEIMERFIKLKESLVKDKVNEGSKSISETQ